VGGFSCEFAMILSRLLQIYWVVMLVYAVVSWIPSLRGRWTDYVAMLVEPVLLPVRRIIPPLGGLDIAFLVVILLVSWLINALPRSLCTLGSYY
jgi:YggT family protein